MSTCHPIRPTLGHSVVALGLSIMALGGPVSADVKSWNAALGDWSVPANWLPFGVPTPADPVLVGNTGLAENATVTLEVNANVPALTITDGMRVNVDGGQLVADTISISGQNLVDVLLFRSRLVVTSSPSLFDCVAETITVSDGARLAIQPGAVLHVDDLLVLDPSSRFNAGGTLTLGGNGAASAVFGSGIEVDEEGLEIIQVGTGLIDLDGNVAGDRDLDVSWLESDGSAFAHLTIEGTGLHDPMDDDVRLSRHNVLTMNLEEGWTLGSGATLRMSGSSAYPGPATLNGSALELQGTISVGGFMAHGIVNAPVTMAPTAHLEVGPGYTLEFNGPVVVQGGTAFLDEGARIAFDDETVVQGGSFESGGIDPDQGLIELNAPTSWSGTVDVAGLTRQIGDAAVSGATTINADRFDLDGLGGTVWSIGNPLTVNADRVDVTDNVMDGEIGLSGTFLGRLTINLDDPGESWTMAGAMNLGGVGAIMITRLEGSPVTLSGLTGVSGKAAVTAATTIADGAIVEIDGSASILRLAGDSAVRSAAQFSGGGLLQSGTTGSMVLEDGLDLDDVGIENLGAVSIDGPGLVVVDRFRNAANATWRVALAGPTAGLDHDLLAITNGAAELDGSLAVEVVDAGAGLFEPQLGDSFTILSAPGTVSGAFDAQPISHVPGRAYLWSVEISAAAVTIELEEIVPCPADLSGDGAVDGADLGILLAAWGPCDECLADLNLDGEVDGADLGVLLASWGPCPL